MRPVVLSEPGCPSQTKLIENFGRRRRWTICRWDHPDEASSGAHGPPSVTLVQQRHATTSIDWQLCGPVIGMKRLSSGKFKTCGFDACALSGLAFRLMTVEVYLGSVDLRRLDQ